MALWDDALINISPTTHEKEGGKGDVEKNRSNE